MMSNARVITLKYKPRGAFKLFHSRKEKKAVLVAHRRAGKTVAAVNDLVARALKIDANLFTRPKYGYICPELKQAKEVAWEYLKDAVRDIPGCKISESELYVRLPNTSVIKLYGADYPDSLRGGYFDGVILDEFGDMKATTVMQVILPALSDRDGWIVYMGTPKGKNDFYDKHKVAQVTPGWFYLSLKASQTGYVAKDVLADRRIDLGDDLYEQEYECSFEAANVGSFYGKQMQELERKDRVEREQTFIERLEIDPFEKVSLAMDIGRRDATAVWFWQIVNGVVRFIDYFEETGYDAEELVEYLQLKPYSYETWWLPHDAKHKTFVSKKSVLDTFRSYDAPCRMVPNLDKKDGIDAVRKTLRTYPLQFDMSVCSRGVEALHNYSRKWDLDKKVFAQENIHDQWSHGADAFRYTCLSINATDLGRSRERYQQRANYPQDRINIGRGGVTNWTMDEAFREREMRSRRAAFAGSPRI